MGFDYSLDKAHVVRWVFALQHGRDRQLGCLFLVSFVFGFRAQLLAGRLVSARS